MKKRNKLVAYSVVTVAFLLIGGLLVAGTTSLANADVIGNDRQGHMAGMMGGGMGGMMNGNMEQMHEECEEMMGQMSSSSTAMSGDYADHHR